MPRTNCLIIAASALLLTVSCAPAENVRSAGGPELASLDIPDVAPVEMPTGTMREVTKVLSSDAFEGRMPGTAGERKSLAYLVKKFAQAGLQPGNRGSWLQDVPLVEITGKNYRSLEISGKSAGQSFPVEHGSGWVGVTFRETPHIALRNSELVFVGYGINAPEKGWNDYAGIDMRGKTAVILVNDPDWQSASTQGLFNGSAMTYYGRWTYKFEEAARQGAAAALIVHDTYPAAYGWNVVQEGWTGPQAYAERADKGASQTLVNGWVQQDVARRIMAEAGQDLDRLSDAAAKPGFRPVPLGLTVSTDFDNSVRRYVSKNVVGILPGSKRPYEYVVHSAHWDHLGRCRADAGDDDICNGAIDNAAGVGAILALAEAHRNAGPAARSLVFMAFTAEEQGLLGSEYYAANPVFPLNRTVGGLNIDTPLLGGPARDVTVVGAGKNDIEAFLAKALQVQVRSASPDPAPEAGFYYRSDHFSFAKRGVPMLYLEGGRDFVEGGRAAGELYYSRYYQNAYHGPKDEFDPKWDWSVVKPDLELYYLVGRMLAESTSWPDWLPGDEFRLIRDKSCSGPGGCPNPRRKGR